MSGKKFRTLTKLLVIVIGCLLLSSFSPSLDGRAVVVEQDVFPSGIFAKTVGYLPGDIISVTNVAGDTTVDILVIGALDPSEGVAIMLSPEAAKAIGIDPEANNIVKITKRSNQEERSYGTAIIAKQDPNAIKNNNSFFEEEKEVFVDTQEKSLEDEKTSQIVQESPKEEVPTQEKEENQIIEEEIIEEVVEEIQEDTPAESPEEENSTKTTEEPIQEELLEEVVEEPIQEEVIEEQILEEVDGVIYEEKQAEEIPQDNTIEQNTSDDTIIEEPVEAETLEDIPEEASYEQYSDDCKEEKDDQPVEEAIVDDSTIEEEIIEEQVVIEDIPLEEPSNDQVLEEVVTEDNIQDVPEEVVLDNNTEELSDSRSAIDEDSLIPVEDLSEKEEEIIEEEIEEPIVEDIITEEVLEDVTEEYEAIVLEPSTSSTDNIIEQTNVEETSINDVQESFVEEETQEVQINETTKIEETTKENHSNDYSSYSSFVVKDMNALKKNTYYVQISVLKSEKTILEIISKYSKKYPIVVVPENNGTKRVMVGPLSIDEYGTVLERFKSYGYKDAFVRKIK